MKSAIIKEFLAHQETIAKVIETMQGPLEEASKIAVETLKNGNNVMKLLNDVVNNLDKDDSSDVIKGNLEERQKMLWTEKYRPKNFDDVLGNIKNVLQIKM